MASSVSNKVFTNSNLTKLIFSNLTIRDLDQIKSVQHVYNDNAKAVQKQQLLRCFPEKYAEIVKNAHFQNFHRERLLAQADICFVGYEPAQVSQLSSPIVAGYVDGVAFIACKVADWTSGKLLRRVPMGMYPQVKDVWGATVLFGMHEYGGRTTEDLLTLLKTGKMVSYVSVEKARPCCCVRLCDWVVKKICNKEIERDRFELPELRIEHFKAKNVNKDKQA